MQRLIPHGRLAAFGIVVATLAAYLPVVAVPYAFEDDYWILGVTHDLGGESAWKAATTGGRPIFGVILTVVFGAVPDIDALRFVRLAGLAVVALVGLLVYYAVQRSGEGPWLSAAVATTIIVLPSFQVYVAWAVLAATPLAAVVAGVAWLRVSASFEASGHTAWLRRGQAGALFLCALFIYQPTAMFFWVFAAIDLLQPTQRLRVAATKLAAGLGVAAAAIAVEYLIVRAAIHVYNGVGAPRSALNHDIVGKARWFWNQPFRNALNAFALVPTWTLATAVGVVAASGLILLHAEHRRELLGFIGIGIALVPLSYTPNLVVEEDWPSYRSLGALAALVVIYVWLGVRGILQAIARRTRPCTRDLVVRSVSAALAIPIVVLGIALAARNVSTLFAKSASSELHMLRSSLDAPRTDKIRRVLFVKPKNGDAPLIRYDEFGFPSTFAPWVPAPAVGLILHEKHQSMTPVIEVFAWDEVGAHLRPGPKTALVDMRKLARHRVTWSYWTVRAIGG